jgi:hypothetical protein
MCVCVCVCVCVLFELRCVGRCGVFMCVCLTNAIAHHTFPSPKRTSHREERRDHAPRQPHHVAVPRAGVLRVQPLHLAVAQPLELGEVGLGKGPVWGGVEGSVGGRLGSRLGTETASQMEPRQHTTQTPTQHTTTNPQRNAAPAHLNSSRCASSLPGVSATCTTSAWPSFS